MLDWIGPAEVAWLAWGGYALRGYLRQRRGPATPATPRTAMLVNAAGTLDSVRTLIGDPPPDIRTARTVYHLDRAHSATHWMYRAHV